MNNNNYSIHNNYNNYNEYTTYLSLILCSKIPQHFRCASDCLSNEILLLIINYKNNT